MNYSLAEIASAVGATLLPATAGRLVPASVGTDSRTATAGELFVCLTGEHFDGHKYAATAVAAGAIAVLGSQTDPPVLDIPYLRVPNSLAALGYLGRYHRDHTRAIVVGITGTAGKTTTKELLACILEVSGATARNILNLNNRVGLPLSLLKASGNECFWVFEAGISKSDEMENLAAILNPDFALILNVGPGHLQGLGDVAGVATAKCGLMRGMAPDGIGIVCVDYPELTAAAIASGRPWIAFSCHGVAAPYHGRAIGMLPPDDTGMSAARFLLHLDGDELEASVPWSAPFMVENVVAAAAIAHLLDLSPEIIRHALAAFSPAAQRFRCVPAGNWLVIDDTYNANPLSMVAAINGAVALAKGQPLVLILAEMHELGAQTAVAHEILGRWIATQNPASIFWHGGHSANVSCGLAASGYAGLWQPVTDPAECLPTLQTLIRHRHTLTDCRPTLLIKGSRANRMERYAQILIKELLQYDLQSTLSS